MKRLWVAFAAIMVATPALAQEPVGCDKFKWPIERERSMLTSATATHIASGSTVANALASAIVIALPPPGQANLPASPERQPKNPNSFAGFVHFAAPPQAGLYAISLSSGAWIDVVQSGKSVKSGPFSGVLGCAGIRKSVQFQLSAEPFVVQITGVTKPSIGVVVTSAAK